MRLEARPATRADVEAFFGKMPPRSIRAWVAERDGEVLGVAGYYLDGPGAVVFSDAKDSLPKYAIWRLSVDFMRGLKMPAICYACDGSGPFLERLGWKFVGNSGEMEVYEWQV